MVPSLTLPVQVSKVLATLQTASVSGSCSSVAKI
jgi:hypothetical protein